MTLGMAFSGQVLRFDQDAFWGLVGVTIPPDASDGADDTVTVTVKSAADTTRSASAVLTASARVIRGSALTPPSSRHNRGPGRKRPVFSAHHQHRQHDRHVQRRRPRLSCQRQPKWTCGWMARACNGSRSRTRAIFSLQVTEVFVTGPYNATGRGETPSRARLFVCRPATDQAEGPCARKILATVSRRAFRRPVTDSDLRPLMAFYQAGRREKDFDYGIEKALRASLTWTFCSASSVILAIHDFLNE